MPKTKNPTAGQPRLHRPDAGSEPSPPRPDNANAPKEVPERAGPDPTRYGDWEKAGRCIDF